MAYPVKGLLEVYEDMAETLLMLQVFLAEDPEIEYLFCGAPSGSKTCLLFLISDIKWTASSEFGTYRLCEQRRFRRACASAQSRQNLRCSLKHAGNQEEP